MRKPFTPMTADEHETLGRLHLEIAAKMRGPAEDPIRPGEFVKAIMAGYTVQFDDDDPTEPWIAMAPEIEGAMPAEVIGPHATERAAWQACDNHRMFGCVIAPAAKDEGPTA